MVIQDSDRLHSGDIVTVAIAYECYPFTCPSKETVLAGLSKYLAQATVVRVEIPWWSTSHFPLVILSIREGITGRGLRVAVIAALHSMNTELLIPVQHAIVTSIQSGEVRPEESPAHSTIKFASAAIIILVVGLLVVRVL